MIDKNTVNHEIPNNWILVDLEQLCGITSGNPAPQNENFFKNGNVPFVRVQDMGRMGNNVYIRETKDYLNNDAVTKNNMKLFPKGSVLFTKSGMSILLNQRAILGSDMHVVSHIGICLPSKYTPSEWIYYWLKSIDFKELTHATTLPSLKLSKVQKIRIPLPPHPEQHRIIAKVEELFTRLDAGVEALKHMQVQLKRYRQSVLKAAVEGKLTAEWRKQHKYELEPADKLLERILKERREMWEAKQLAKDESQSKIPPKNWQDKYKEPTPPDTSNLPDLPEGWAWLRADTICEKIQDGTHFSPKVQYSDKSYRRYLYVTAKNIRGTGVNLSNISYVDEEFHRMIYKRCNVEKNDVLLIKDGVKTGIATVNQLDQEFSLLSSVALLKPNRKCLNPWYFKNFLNSPIGCKMVTGKMTGTAIKRIILQRIKGTLIAVPPIKEQAKIVEEVEKHISIIEGSETMIESELKRAQSLRQSILKRAFEGKLVAQDPNDEPASVLLDRIKEEKDKPNKSKQMEMF